MFVKVTGDAYDNDDPTAYSPRHFYTLEVGRESVHVKLGDSSARTVSRLVNDDRFIHYQTKADVIRDAVVHRLHFLVENVLNDPVLSRELEREFKRERIRIAIGRLEQVRVSLEKAGDQFCNIMRDRMAKQQPLDREERELLEGFRDEDAGNLPPDLHAEFETLWLFFLAHPDQFYDLGGDPEDDPEWVRNWERRRRFWDDKDHTYMTHITREVAAEYYDIDEAYRAAQARVSLTQQPY